MNEEDLLINGGLLFFVCRYDRFRYSSGDKGDEAEEEEEETEPARPAAQTITKMDTSTE